MVYLSRLVTTLLGFTYLTGQEAQAQTLPPSREQINPPAQSAAPPPPVEAHIDERGAFAPGPCPLATSTVNVAIHQVQFTGPNGGDLPPVFAQLFDGIGTSGESQPIRVVCDLRDQANARLRAARYVATVQIPAQRIDDGALRLEVVSGHITQVRLRGDAGPFENLVRARIEKLSALNPLNAGEAEKLLVLTNDTPGLTVQLGLSPNTSGKPGDLVGELKVSYRRVTVMANAQNYNSTLLGRETIYTRAEVYSLLGKADQAFVAAASTLDLKKQKILQLGESVGLSSAGDRLSLVGTIAYSRPALDTLDLRTLSIVGDLEYSRPLVRTVRTKVEVNAGFEYILQRTRVFGASGSVPLNRDRIATFYTRLDGDTRQLRVDGSQKWDLSGSLELRKGMNILGATRAGQFVNGYSPTHFNGHADAFVVRGKVAGVYGLGPVIEVATSLQGQWTNKELLNYDQFAIGNLTIGRGYDPGANSGDRSIAGSHELRANLVSRPDVRVQPYGFYDWVHLWNLDRTSTERSRQLASVGGGVRITLFNSIRADVTYAHPLDPPLLTGVNIKRSPNRLMLSITAQIFPFGSNR